MEVVYAALLGAILPGAISFIALGHNLRKKNQAGGEKVIAEKIATALLAVRDLELKLRIFEIPSDVDIRVAINQGGVSIPAIFLNKEALIDFQNEFMSVWKSNEGYLDMTTVAFLLTMQAYLGAIMVNTDGSTDGNVQKTGLLVKDDIVKWQKDFDEHLVKQVNKKSYKLSSLNGPKWEAIKKENMSKYFDTSDLMKLLTNNLVA